MTLFWIASLPFAAVFLAALAIGRGRRVWLPVALAGVSLAAGAACLRAIVLTPSCEIAESECMGAMATVYLIAFLWCAPAIGLALRLFDHMRSGFGRR